MLPYPHAPEYSILPLRREVIEALQALAEFLLAVGRQLAELRILIQRALLRNSNGVTGRVRAGSVNCRIRAGASAETRICPVTSASTLMTRAWMLFGTSAPS